MKPLRLSSIQYRLGITFLAFLALLVVSVGVTFIGLQVQDQDGRIINLAGRQRMLLQQMTSLALGYSQASQPGGWHAQALSEITADFEQTLAAMQAGGQIEDYTGVTLSLPAPSGPELPAALAALRVDWDAYRQGIERLLSTSDPAASAQLARKIETQSAAITAKADQVVQSYEHNTEGRLARLRAYQVAFLIAGLGVLGVGWWLTHKAIVLPLRKLAAAARAIGDGALEHPVRVDGLDEPRMLGSALDQMRQQILDSRLSLQQWAEMLEDRVGQRTRELEALTSVSQEITSHLSIGEVLNSVAQKARELSGADVASLCLLDTDGKVLNLHATDGPPRTVKHMQSPAGLPATQKVLRLACSQPCDMLACEGGCQILDPQFLFSHLAVPLLSKGRVTGALCIGSQQADAFRPEVKTMLSQLAGVTSVALENSRLYRQAENLATLQERQRIAAEMHDGSLQTLDFLRLMARWAHDQIQAGAADQALSAIQQIERAGNQMEDEIRRAIASLQDDFPLQYTLQEKLAAMAQELSQADLPVHFQPEALTPLVLSVQESEQALRIVREAVLNAKKHSRSDRVEVTLTFDPAGQEITLVVRDFGTGFGPAHPIGDGRSHFGLKIMRARAARLGGDLRVGPGAGSGTEVTLSWKPASITSPLKEI